MSHRMYYKSSKLRSGVSPASIKTSLTPRWLVLNKHRYKGHVAKAIINIFSCVSKFRIHGQVRTYSANTKNALQIFRLAIKTGILINLYTKGRMLSQVK